MSDFKVKLGRPEKIMLANISDRKTRKAILGMIVENISLEEKRRRAKNTVLDPTPAQEVVDA